MHPVFLLVVWKILALYFRFLLLSYRTQEDTFVTVLQLFTDKDFLVVAGVRFFRGMVGFVISFFLGLAVGIIAGISPGVQCFYYSVAGNGSFSSCHLSHTSGPDAV